MIFNERFINEKLFLNKDSFTIKKISDDEYFGNEYKHCISNSKLRYISPSQNGSPFEYKYGNQNESASFLDVGTIMHRYILEDKLSKIVVGDMPTTDKMINILKEAASIQVNTNTKFNDIIDGIAEKHKYKNKKVFDKNVLKFRKYYKFLLDNDPEAFFINEKSNNVLEKCSHSMTSIKEYLNSQVGEHHYEEAVFGSFTYKNDYKGNTIPTILNVKAKIDNFIVDHESKTIILNDLKTTISPIDEFMETSFKKFRYDRQFAFYLYLLNNAINPKDEYRLLANVITISKLDGKFQIFKIKQSSIEDGYHEFQDCLKRIGFHETYGYNVLRESI